MHIVLAQYFYIIFPLIKWQKNVTSSTINEFIADRLIEMLHRMFLI